MDILFHPTPAGAALAAFAVAGGAPLFGEGLRVLRLRRALAGLKPTDIADAPIGVAYLSGRVALEGPLFGPISGKPCAGFKLEVRGAGGATVNDIEVKRNFRIVDGDRSAQVHGAAGVWEIATSASRTFAAAQPFSENLTHLLAECPEALWLRRQGIAITLVEHALLAGATCHVIGTARQTRAYELPV